MRWDQPTRGKTSEPCSHPPTTGTIRTCKPPCPCCDEDNYEQQPQSQLKFDATGPSQMARVKRSLDRTSSPTTSTPHLLHRRAALRPHIRPAAQGYAKRHLQLNPAVIHHWLVFEIDVPAAALVWEHFNLPTQNGIAVNPANAHAHHG